MSSINIAKCRCCDSLPSQARTTDPKPTWVCAAQEQTEFWPCASSKTSSQTLWEVLLPSSRIGLTVVFETPRTR